MPAPLRYLGGRSAWRVFAVTFLIYAYFMPRWADWNIDSRLDLVHAIVDDHSLRIDRYHFNTWDKAFVRSPATGVVHYYSDKAPGTAALGAVVYAGYELAHRAPVVGGGIDLLLKNGAWRVPIELGKTGTQYQPASRGTNLGGCQRSGVAGNVQYIPWGNRLVPPMRDWALSKYVVTIGVVSTVSALFSTFFFWFLGFFVRSRWCRWVLTILYATCSVALPYSTNLYSHQLAAAFLFTAFALLYLLKIGCGRGWFAAAAGFLLGAALLTEYTVLIIVAFVGLYALSILWRRRQAVLALCLAGTAPLLALLAYNKACFGGWFDTGYSHDFCWSSAQAAGIAGFTSPHLDVIVNLTVDSYRGLFYMSPFLLLALPGAFLAARRGVGRECWLCIAIGVTFIVVLSAYWGWNGGKVDGPRYLVPVVPFLAFPCIFVIDMLTSVPRAWVFVLPVTLWSAFATWTEFLGGALFPVSWYPDPIFQYSLLYLHRNDIAPNAASFLGLHGWISLLPLIGMVALVGLTGRWSRPPDREDKHARLDRFAATI